MTIKAKLEQGPTGYGLPEQFSITGAANQTEQGAAVYVRGTKFIGLAEGNGGVIEQPNYDLETITIKSGEKRMVGILFQNTNTKKREVERAVYEVTGS